MSNFDFWFCLYKYSHEIGGNTCLQAQIKPKREFNFYHYPNWQVTAGVTRHITLRQLFQFIRNWEIKMFGRLTCFWTGERRERRFIGQEKIEIERRGSGRCNWQNLSYNEIVTIMFSKISSSLWGATLLGCLTVLNSSQVPDIFSQEKVHEYLHHSRISFLMNIHVNAWYIHL